MIINYVILCQLYYFSPYNIQILICNNFNAIDNAIDCSFSLQFLQNLGKVDRTADDIFDEHLQNFMRQQNAANRLQKEFNNYIRCVRGKFDWKSYWSKLSNIYLYKYNLL